MIGQLINADCERVIRSIGDESVDLILTDPPYKNYRSNRPTKDRRLSPVKALDFQLPMFARESYRILKPGHHLYCFCDHRHETEVRQALEFIGFWFKQTLIWVKNNHGCGDLKGAWAPKHELILFFTKGKGKPLNHPRRPDVLLFPRVRPKRFKCGTVKPPDLLRQLIQSSSDEHDLILDPYAGTGSTGEAAFYERRRFVLIEKDLELYFQARNRLAKLVAFWNQKSGDITEAFLMQLDKDGEYGLESIYCSPMPGVEAAC